MHSPIKRRSIDSADLNAILAFNQQLKRLVQIGIPIHWPNNSDPHAVIPQSELAVKELAFQVAQGASLLGALRNEKSIPEAYKLSFATWFTSGGATIAFDILKSPQLLTPDIQQRWTWRFQLKLLLAVALVTFVVWQSTGGTQLRQLYRDSSFGPGPIGRIGVWINANIWDTVWGASGLTNSGVALLVSASLLGLSYFAFRRSPPMADRQASLSKSATEQLYLSTFVRSSLASGLSIQDTSDLLVTMSSPARNSDEPDADETLQNNTTDPIKLYAVHWARTHRVDDAVRRFSIRTPYLTYVFIGGLVVLLMAVCVYAPVFEFISSLESEKRF